MVSTKRLKELVLLQGLFLVFFSVICYRDVCTHIDELIAGSANVAIWLTHRSLAQSAGSRAA